MRKKVDPGQGDLFHKPVYPERMPKIGMDGPALRSKVSRAMSEALRDCGVDRYEVAKRMAVELGKPSFSKAMLDSYTAESKDAHNISFVVLVAFVRATGCGWVWDHLLNDEGFTVLQVARRAMREGEADLKLAIMGSVRETLLFCQRHEESIRAFIRVQGNDGGAAE